MLGIRIINGFDNLVRDTGNNLLNVYRLASYLLKV